MTVIKLTDFAGEVPRLGVEQLPQSAASIAENALLLSGELRGLHTSRISKDLTTTPYVINRFFRIPQSPADDIWVTFNEKNTHFLKGTLIEDAFERYYWTEEGQVPRFNTLARIQTSSPAYTLGVPRPANAPIVSSTGGTGDVITRGYTYTFVSEYGEEGPPSDITLFDGRPDDTWTITNTDTTVPDAANRPTFTKRLYRTISSNVGTVMFLVEDNIALGAQPIDDILDDSVVALNAQLESWNWYAPPLDLEGIITHPNGFMVGFSGRDLYFSEPYRPHAFPPEYVVSTAYNIVGLGIFGSSIAIMTDGYPSIATGIHPSTMTMAESEFTEPCLSKHGIVSMPFGVYYPGPNGLMLVNQNGIQNSTKKIITKDEWILRYFPEQLDAARWQDFYVAFYTPGAGFILAPSEPQAAFTQLGHSVWSQQSIQTDPYSGEVLYADDNFIFIWNPPDGIPLDYRWRSKEYSTDKPINLGAARVYWEASTLTPGAVDDIIAYNTQRMALPPLNTFGSRAIGGGDPVVLAPPALFPTPARMPLGGSSLSDSTRAVATHNMTVRVFAHGELVYNSAMPHDEMFRLPSGYKADRWKFEFEGTGVVKSAVFAETGKELSRG